MTLDEMCAALAVWDQTIGCQHCQHAYWMDEAIGELEEMLWHAPDCPLYGRADGFVEWNLRECSIEQRQRVEGLLRDGHRPECVSTAWNLSEPWTCTCARYPTIQPPLPDPGKKPPTPA